MSLKEIWEAICNAWKKGLADITGLENEWAQEDLRVIVSVVVGIATAVILGVMTHRKIAKREKQKQISIQTGKVIKAKCVQVYREYDTDEDTGVRDVTYHGVYEYTVDGKTKRYRVFDKGGLPRDHLPLYYVDTPRKAFSDYDNVQLGYNLAGLLGIVAGVLTMFLTDHVS